MKRLMAFVLGLALVGLALPVWSDGLPAAKPESVGLSQERLDRVTEALDELADGRLIGWDRDNRVVFVRDTLAVESLENQNVVKGAVKELG